MNAVEPMAQWTQGHPWQAALLAAGVLVLLGGAVWAMVRALRIMARLSNTVIVASLAAAGCTGYSADTSWEFAGQYLGMHTLGERAAFFAAAEGALLACALIARASKAATATETSAGSPGVAGMLVWAITGVQILPAYAVSGVIGGTVRGFIGPVMAAMLWHMAMGLEIRVIKPGALSTGLPALIGRELRQRLLSRLGLGTRDRTAAQMTQDRASARGVRLASRKHLGAWGESRLAAAVTASGIGTDPERRHRFMKELAARRTSRGLRNVPVTSPWEEADVPEAYPRTPLGVTGAQLRAMDPFAAISHIHRSHPDATPAELASITTQYGVPVSETQVRLVIGAGNPPSARRTSRTRGPVPDAVPAVPAQVTGSEPPQESASELPPADLKNDEPAGLVGAVAASRTRNEVHAHVSEPDVPDPDVPDPDVPDPDVPDPDVPDPDPDVAPAPEPPSTAGSGTDPLFSRAREIDSQYRRERGRTIPIRHLKERLNVGQTKATALQKKLSASS